MIKVAFFFVFSCMVSVVFCQDACTLAFNRCNFRIGLQKTNSPSTFNIKLRPDVPFTPRIVSKKSGERVGVFNSNGRSPDFIFARRTIPITDFGLTPSHFKPYSINGTTGSGIGHQTFSNTQLATARFRCVRVYLTQYQVFGDNGMVENVVKNPPTNKDCVVFRTT